MQSFRAWLQDPERDYMEGLAIYNKYRLSPKHDAFLQCKQPTVLHRNILHKLMLTLFHILSSTGRFPTASKEKDISVSADPPSPVVVTDGMESPSRRVNQAYVNRLLTLSFEDLSTEEKALFHEDPQYFDMKKKAFLSNADIDREMRGLHAKMKALDEGAEQNSKRQEILLELKRLDGIKTSQWKLIDRWERPLENVVEKESVKQKVLDDLKRIKANVTFIRRNLNTLESLPRDTPRQKDKFNRITAEIEKRKQELIDLGHPFNPVS